MAIEVDRVQVKEVTGAERQPLIPSSPGKDTESIINGVQTGLLKLVDLFEQTPGITNDDRVKLAGIINEYKELVTENLGAAPGEPIKKEPVNPRLDMVPPEVGAAIGAVMMGPNVGG